MRSRATVVALLCLLFCVPVPAAADAPYARLDAYVRDHMKAPGLAYAVVGPDGPLHRRSWGTDGRGDPVTGATPFLWGSVAKPVTATGVMTLVQSGRLGLDDPVVDHVPGFAFGGAAHARGVTVRHLLGHTSGIPAEATFAVADCHDAGCPRPAGRLDALNGYEPLGPPGTEYTYTSANYVVLAAVIESVTGRPFAGFMREAVFDPFGMDGAIADSKSAQKRNLTPGHQYLWGFPAATADGYDPHGAAYGYMGGDINDLAAFAAAQLRPESVLTPESVRLMRQESKDGTGYGLGWRVGGLDAPLQNAIWHTGASPGYSAMIFLLPERDIALVLHQNLYGLLQDGPIMAVGFGAARVLAGGEPGDVPSAATHHAAVWGVTALAAGLLLATGRSIAVLRRPAGRRRVAATVGWCLAGAVPLLIAAAVLTLIDARRLMAWVPDATVALGVAVAAGAATIALRLARSLRP
ncbi:serine hydrolase domain-containing protein [Actinomadura algeriensis]|uniref:CubicO group peptidase (Beta-lactamase class C family) n=1 Tax=Actinomadura algeriensis TaxID=1679523 RepID=A0ABR9JL32_9ACTN|nr:serine hydrolase domain-containing protein [Actinomadura algeriensis]MBE1531261.1 CubicO group peptidase (beta-lactamase class C family) [Actinomadura algeriensis]